MQKQDRRFVKLDEALIPNGFEKHIDGDFYIYVSKNSANIYINGILMYDIVYIEVDRVRGSIFFYKDIQIVDKVSNEPYIEQTSFSLIDLIETIEVDK